MFDKEKLKALEKKLATELESVRRVIALDENPDLILVSKLLGEEAPAATVQNLFESPAASKPTGKGKISNKEIRTVILKFATPFKFADATDAVKKEFPDRILKAYSIPFVLRHLREANKIKEVVAREGRNGATYAKV